MRYTDLIFDLYGTLVDIHTDENDLVWEKTAFYFGFYGARYTPGELKDAFRATMDRWGSEAGQDYECFPEIPCQQVMTELFIAKGVTRNAEALGMNAAQLFRICSLEYIRVYPGALQALTDLRNQGYRIWLLSNAQRAFTEYELRYLELEGYFDGIYLSSDYRCRKPDKRFFDALIQERSLDVASCLMIGNDRATDIQGASEAGLATLYMHTALTPQDQAPADPRLYPLPQDVRRHMEFEGDDWEELGKILKAL